jgi:hypothetical protein
VRSILRGVFGWSVLKLLWVRLIRPFLVLRFKWLAWRANNKTHPILWLTPAKRLELDLELFEDAENKYLNKELLEELAKTRDAIFDRARKQYIVSMLALIFLAADYFAIKVDFSISGFSLKIAPGIKEGLLLIVNIIAFNTLMLQSNAASLNAAIRHIISRIYPEELRALQSIKYFAQEYYVPYQPFNLPHITPTFMASNLAIYGSAFFALLAISVASGIFALNIAIVIDMWLHPALGIWSKVVCVYVLLLGAGALFYSSMTRFWLPYRDYTALDELRIMEQIHPERLDARRAEIYKETSAVFDEMRKRDLPLPFERDAKLHPASEGRGIGPESPQPLIRKQS